MAAAASPAWRWLTAIVAPALALSAFALIAQNVSFPWPFAAGVVAFACVSAEVLVASALTPDLPARALLYGAIPLAALIALALAGSQVTDVPAAMIVTIGLLTLGTLIGGIVGRAVEKPGHLIVVAIVSSLVDAFSVLHPSGPTAQLIQIEAAVNILVLPWPLLGTPRIVPVLGVGDVAFAALYTVASRRHGLPVTRTIIALSVGLAITLFVVAATGIGIPALPFLGAAVVIAHPAARRLSKEDREKAFYGLAVLLACFVLLGALLFALR